MSETEPKIKDVALKEELSKRYLSYAMSTIVSRSLPMLLYFAMVIYIGLRVVSFFAGYVNAINELME